MKKLLLSLLTAATAATAVACISGCTSGQTGGGDNNTEKQADFTQFDAPAAPQEQTTDGEFGFMPPQMPSGMGEIPLPPPFGRIFNHTGRDPELLRDMTAGGSVKEGSPAANSKPSGRIRKKKDKRPDDIVTPDGNISPDNKTAKDGQKLPAKEKNVPEKQSCPDCDEKATENSSRDGGEKQDKSKRQSTNRNRKKLKKQNDATFG